MIAEFSNWLRPTSPRNETVKQCRRQTNVANSPVQWLSWTWCRTWRNHLWHSSRVTLNQRCFAFIRPPLVYRYHVISRTQSHVSTALFWLEQHPRRVVQRRFDSWATSILVGLNMDRTLSAQIDAKTKFKIGNIVPKQWTLSRFVQHTSANSMYKDDNKISQQQNYCI